MFTADTVDLVFFSFIRWLVTIEYSNILESKSKFFEFDFPFVYKYVNFTLTFAQREWIRWIDDNFVTWFCLNASTAIFFPFSVSKSKTRFTKWWISWVLLHLADVWSLWSSTHNKIPVKVITWLFQLHGFFVWIFLIGSTWTIQKKNVFFFVRLI